MLKVQVEIEIAVEKKEGGVVREGVDRREFRRWVRWWWELFLLGEHESYMLSPFCVFTHTGQEPGTARFVGVRLSACV